MNAAALWILSVIEVSFQKGLLVKPVCDCQARNAAEQTADPEWGQEGEEVGYTSAEPVAGRQ